MARVSISAVWDRTTDFMSDRAGAAMGMAAPAIFAALVAYGFAARLSGGANGLAFLALMLLQIVALWGQLQIMALAIDPAVTPAEAVQRATNRLPAVLLLLLVLLAGMVVIALPGLAMILGSGLDFQKLASLGPNPDPEQVRALISPRAASLVAAAALYGLLALAVATFVLVRLGLVYVIALVEAVALPALRRSWVLTRQMSLALAGVGLLYAVVSLVATSAAQGVAGTVLGLFFGSDDGFGVTSIATVLVGAVVSTPLVMLSAAFTAKFYLAQRRAEEAAPR